MVAVAKKVNPLTQLPRRSKSEQVKACPVEGRHDDVVRAAMDYVSKKHHKTLEELAKV